MNTKVPILCPGSRVICHLIYAMLLDDLALSLQPDMVLCFFLTVAYYSCHLCPLKTFSCVPTILLMNECVSNKT